MILQEFPKIQSSMGTWLWLTDTTTQRRTWRMVRNIMKRSTMHVNTFYFLNMNGSKFAALTIYYMSQQTQAGALKQLSVLWWSALAGWVSLCSAHPASWEIFPGRSWWCPGFTQTDLTRRALDSSFSAMLSQTLRKQSLLLHFLV